MMEDVLEAAGECTVLLITHRPEGIDQMDEVVTLDAGRCVCRTLQARSATP